MENRPEADDIEDDHGSKTFEELPVYVEWYSEEAQSMREGEQEDGNNELREEEEQRHSCGI